MKTLPIYLNNSQTKSSKISDTRCSEKKRSLMVPALDDYLVNDCIRSDRVIVEFMTRYILGDEEEKN